MRATTPFLFCLLAGATAAQDAVEVDPQIPAYTQVEGVSGSLKSMGSDTMNNLMTLWGEGFGRVYPGVRLEVEGKGSGTAPPALTGGLAHFAPMSRAMKADEIDRFEKKFGYKPVVVRAALDVLAVYVNKDNPVVSLTLPEVDAIFSKTRRGGFAKDIASWGDLGLTSAWANLPVSAYGRNSASGTYGYFKEHALFKGDFKDTVREQPGSSSVVQAVAADRAGVGYSGIGYRTADVRAVPLATAPGEPPFAADMENAYAGTYPLSRFLYIYVNREPNRPLDPLRAQFLRYVLSREGQRVVVKDGYIPLPSALVAEERAKLGIEEPSR